MGFKSKERQDYIRHLSRLPLADPWHMLGELVADPEELLCVMQDCGAVLFDSRAAGYFWPLSLAEESGWDFYVHPNSSSWLRFALYLAQIGVEWTIPEQGKVESEEEFYISSYNFAGDPVLTGMMTTATRKHKIHVVAHSPNERSSMVPITYAHSSLVQCLITGCGAFSMNARLTRYGQSRAWEPRDNTPEQEDVRNCAQKAIDKYVARGVVYLGPSLPQHTKAPRARRRQLGDTETMSVSFAPRFSKPKRRLKAHFDFERMENLAWYEYTTRLTHEEPDDDHATLPGSHMPDAVAVPVYDELLHAFACQHCNCDTDEPFFCELHLPTGPRLTLLQMLLWYLYVKGGEFRTTRADCTYSVI